LQALTRAKMAARLAINEREQPDYWASY